MDRNMKGRGSELFTSIEAFKAAFIKKMESKQGKSIDEATPLDSYKVLGTLIREHISKDLIKTNHEYRNKGVKQAYYFSMEFLLGRLMSNNILNLNILEVVEQGLEELGFRLEEIVAEEADAGLGNGGLGRLAACFLDSLASLELPGHGCGIRYKYGLFEQKVIDGYQVEFPDYWLNKEYVWEIKRPDKKVEVRFGGDVHLEEVDGKLKPIHTNYERVIAVPYDVPVIGYKNHTVNTLRLWGAESVIDNDKIFAANTDDYYQFLNYKRSVEAISEFLYPDDSSYEGKVLRLKQQYFLVSAGLQSIIRTFRKQNLPFSEFPNKVSLHINDTHPALLIPELMRLLMDENGLGWDEAWDITTKAMSYTNHTTLSEALEKWPIEMVRNLLPRIYMIIEEINERFCAFLWDQYPGQFDRIHQMAIIADGQVKMAHLAIVGSHSVNGVAKIHTEILKKREMNLFYQVYPHKFNNKTNGITHRRWLLNANPELAQLINDTIGTRWIRHPKDLLQIMKYRDDPSFKQKLQKIKYENKEKLAQFIESKYDLTIDPNSIFDVHVKRLHGYKRQLLNILHVMHLYNTFKENPQFDMYPRTFIFGAKAAPGYHFAKKVIKLINSVADIVNNDKSLEDKLKVVFLENYSVSLAEMIIPATDVSEQISTASKEASGTGNMKFMMNGALTIGTLDGANVEIHEMVGDDNFFKFGLTADEVLNYYKHGGYYAQDVYNSDIRIKKIMDQLIDNSLFPMNEFDDIYYSILTHNDEYFVLKDFDAYAETHEMIDVAYRNQDEWLKKCICNIAHSGKFASDRTIAEYAAEIWRINPLTIDN